MCQKSFWPLYSFNLQISHFFCLDKSGVALFKRKECRRLACQHCSFQSAVSGCGPGPLPLPLLVNSWLDVPPLLFYYLRTYPVLVVSIETRRNKRKKIWAISQLIFFTPGRTRVGCHYPPLAIDTSGSFYHLLLLFIRLLEWSHMKCAEQHTNSVGQETQYLLLVSESTLVIID